MLKLSEEARAELISRASADPRRHFLFLQGLPGPFFRRLAAALRARGHRASRVHFNGGDWWDWRGAPGATSFRGHSDGFAAWLDDHIARNDITDVILFGDNRPLHRPRPQGREQSDDWGRSEICLTALDMPDFGARWPCSP